MTLTELLCCLDTQSLCLSSNTAQQARSNRAGEKNRSVGVWSSVLWLWYIQTEIQVEWAAGEDSQCWDSSQAGHTHQHSVSLSLRYRDQIRSDQWHKHTTHSILAPLLLSFRAEDTESWESRAWALRELDRFSNLMNVGNQVRIVPPVSGVSSATNNPQFSQLTDQSSPGHLPPPSTLIMSSRRIKIPFIGLESLLFKRTKKETKPWLHSWNSANISTKYFLF